MILPLPNLRWSFLPQLRTSLESNSGSPCIDQVEMQDPRGRMISIFTVSIYLFVQRNVHDKIVWSIQWIMNPLSCYRFVRDKELSSKKIGWKLELQILHVVEKGSFATNSQIRNVSNKIHNCVDRLMLISLIYGKILRFLLAVKFGSNLPEKPWLYVVTESGCHISCTIMFVHESA